MELDEIKRRIENKIKNSTAILSGDGCNCSVVVISDQFLDKNLLQKQKMVMNTVSDLIASGELHALSVKTYSQHEWQEINK